MVTIKYVKGITATCLALAMMAFSASSGRAVQAAGPGMNDFVDGVEAYDRGDYHTALKAFDRAISKDGGNLTFQYHYGRAYSRLGRNDEATAIFNAILARDSKTFGEAYFDLAGIYIRQKNYTKAMKTLEDAEWAMPDKARVYLEKGYLAMRMKDAKDAEANLRRAMELDSSLAQTVFYHLGLIRMNQRRYEEARPLFEKAAKGPDPKLSEAARSAIANTGAIKRAAKPWHLVASLAWAYDSNIPNDPLDRPGISPAPVQDLGDQYQYIDMNAFVRIPLRGGLNLNTGYGFSYLNYSDSDNENSVGNSPYLQLLYDRNSWSADLRYTFSYYTADGKSKLNQHSLSPTLVVREPYGMQSVASLVYLNKDYRDDGLTPDATHLAGRFRQEFSIPQTAIRPMLGLAVGDEDADSDAATYTFIEAKAGVEFMLPFDMQGILSYTDIRSDYDIRYGSAKREDTAGMISALFSRKIVEGVLMRLSYLYVKNDSNVTTTTAPYYDPYEYDKHIVLVQMEVTL